MSDPYTLEFLSLAESQVLVQPEVSSADRVAETEAVREEVLSALDKLTDAQLAVAYALVMHFEQDDGEIVRIVRVGAAAFRKHRTAAFNVCEVDTRYELKKDCQREIAAAYLLRFATVDLPPPKIGRRRQRRRGRRGW